MTSKKASPRNGHSPLCPNFKNSSLNRHGPDSAVAPSAMGMFMDRHGVLKHTALSLLIAAALPLGIADAQAQDNASGTQAAQLEKVTVTGSMIPRAQVEGPAPITVISAKDILQRGFATTTDILVSLSQNLGAVDNNQNTNGFSNGAQAVDLRGLGPNHTLEI